LAKDALFAVTGGTTFLLITPSLADPKFLLAVEYDEVPSAASALIQTTKKADETPTADCENLDQRRTRRTLAMAE